MSDNTIKLLENEARKMVSENVDRIKHVSSEIIKPGTVVAHLVGYTASEKIETEINIYITMNFIKEN